MSSSVKFQYNQILDAEKASVSILYVMFNAQGFCEQPMGVTIATRAVNPSIDLNFAD
jgi:hypothetical protein